MRYPRNGSRTNCHGLVAEGFRIKQNWPRQESSHEVRNESVLAPVATSDHITGARAREGDARTVEQLGREERFLIGFDHQFRAPLELE